MAQQQWVAVVDIIHISFDSSHDKRPKVSVQYCALFQYQLLFVKGQRLQQIKCRKVSVKATQYINFAALGCSKTSKECSDLAIILAWSLTGRNGPLHVVSIFYRKCSYLLFELVKVWQMQPTAANHTSRLASGLLMLMGRSNRHFCSVFGIPSKKLPSAPAVLSV